MSTESCPECFKILESGALRCRCGWNAAGAIDSSPAYHRPFPPREPWAGVTEYGSQTAKEMVKFAKSFGQKVPDRSWAPRLLARVAAGEKICNRGIELAREVVAMGPDRVPGEDDAR